MIQPSNRTRKQLHQRYSQLDNEVFSAFCDTFNGIKWIADYMDGHDDYCGIDLQLTAMTSNNVKTYDIEIKSVHLYKLLDYCFFQPDKWLELAKYDNDYKLYVVIYPYHDLIAVWNVNGDLLRSSEKEISLMNRNTANGNEKVEKQVYKLPLSKARKFTFNLNDYKEKYNALDREKEQKHK